MGEIKCTYSGKDLTTLADEMLEGVDRAVMAAAIHVRDNMKQSFLSGSTLYKHGTSKYRNLVDGIRVGKLHDGKVRIHALGGRDNYDTYKTRFFVGGTIPRTQTKQNGKNIKPYTKGYIKANSAIDLGFSGAENILTTFINNVINN